MQKEQLLNLLGPFPQKTALNPAILEAIDCGSYIREKVAYDVEPGERITAYLLIPKNLKVQTPVIFCYHQHGSRFDLGKSEVAGLAGDPGQATAAELAELGYITFAPDAIGFEERNWDPAKPGNTSWFELATRLIRGETLLAKALHDVSAGIDYLQTRAEADSEKIGFIGHSYGGRMAIWATALDKRIKVAVSHCGCASYQNSAVRTAGIQMEFCVPGIVRYGDIGDIVKMAEPSSLYLSATDEDRWSKGAREIYDYAKPAFILGELQLKVWPGKHVFTRQMREEAYAFLKKLLRKA